MSLSPLSSSGVDLYTPCIAERKSSASKRSRTKLPEREGLEPAHEIIFISERISLGVSYKVKKCPCRGS